MREQHVSVRRRQMPLLSTGYVSLPFKRQNHCCINVQIIVLVICRLFGFAHLFKHSVMMIFTKTSPPLLMAWGPAKPQVHSVEPTMMPYVCAQTRDHLQPHVSLELVVGDAGVCNGNTL